MAEWFFGNASGAIQVLDRGELRIVDPEDATIFGSETEACNAVVRWKNDHSVPPPIRLVLDLMKVQPRNPIDGISHVDLDDVSIECTSTHGAPETGIRITTINARILHGEIEVGTATMTHITNAFYGSYIGDEYLRQAGIILDSHSAQTSMVHDLLTQLGENGSLETINGILHLDKIHIIDELRGQGIGQRVLTIIRGIADTITGGTGIFTLLAQGHDDQDEESLEVTARLRTWYTRLGLTGTRVGDKPMFWNLLEEMAPVPLQGS